MLHVSTRSMWVSKLTLRCITFVFDIITLGLPATDVSLGLLLMGPPVNSCIHFLSPNLQPKTHPFRFLCLSAGASQNSSASLNAVATGAFIQVPTWAWIWSFGSA